ISILLPLGERRMSPRIAPLFASKAHGAEKVVLLRRALKFPCAPGAGSKLKTSEFTAKERLPRSLILPERGMAEPLATTEPNTLIIADRPLRGTLTLTVAWPKPDSGPIEMEAGPLYLPASSEKSDFPAAPAAVGMVKVVAMIKRAAGRTEVIFMIVLIQMGKQVSLNFREDQVVLRGNLQRERGPGGQDMTIRS